MYRAIMSFLGVAVLCLLAAGDFRGAAEAAVVPVSRANVEGNIADGDETTKTLQEIIDDDATYVGDRDILDFAPGEYKDAGELLVTRPLTLRKAPGSAGDVKFTGKFMINIKSDDVVVEGLTFMDVTVPDIVTIEVDRDPGTTGNQPLLYGFPGKTLADFFKERLANQQVLDRFKANNRLDDDQIRGYFGLSSSQLPSPVTAEKLAGLKLTSANMECLYDEDYDESSGIIYDLTDDGGCDELTYNNELWVTVAGSPITADNGQIANHHTGDPVSVYAFNPRLPVPGPLPPDPDTPRPLVPGQLPPRPIVRPSGPPELPPSFEIVNEAITSAKAKNGLGTIWVDAYAPDGACETAENTGGQEVEVAEIKGVMIRNNTFNGTEIAAVRAGDQGYPGPTGATYVIPGTRVPLVPTTYVPSRPRTERPFCQDIQCLDLARPRAYCRTELDVIANTFMNVGGTGDFAKDSNGELFEDDDGNKIAEVGNREPAIDLGNVVRAQITDNTIDGGTWDAVVLSRTPEGARINIKNNLITNTILDGIKVHKSVTTADAQSETSIMIMGNRVTGTSMNRYITLHNSWNADVSDLAVEDSYDIQRDVHCSLIDETLIEEGLLVNGFWTTEGEAAANRLLAPEIWRSAIPGFLFSSPTGAPASNLNEDGTLIHDPYFDETGNEGIGYTGLVRVSAERCFTSRIKVMDQPGVSIIDNDLGYSGVQESGVAPAGSPEYGLVVRGAGTTLAAFSGNNIDYFGQASVLSDTGKAIPTNGNYLGPTPSVQTGVERSFAAGDAYESEPLAGTPDASRVIGPRDSMLNPDRTVPMLTRAEVNEAGTVITLVYSESLDESSVPSAGDYVVRKQTAAGERFLVSVTEVAVEGASVVLTLSAGIEAGEMIAVAYSGDMIRDAAGNIAAPITAGQTVTNNVGGAGGAGGGGGAGGAGGCVLASAAGNGADAGMLLPLMLAGLALGRRLGRKGL